MHRSHVCSCVCDHSQNRVFGCYTLSLLISECANFPENRLTKVVKRKGELTRVCGTSWYRKARGVNYWEAKIDRMENSNERSRIIGEL